MTFWVSREDRLAVIQQTSGNMTKVLAFFPINCDLALLFLGEVNKGYLRFCGQQGHRPHEKNQQFHLNEDVWVVGDLTRQDPSLNLPLVPVGSREPFQRMLGSRGKGILGRIPPDIRVITVGQVHEMSHVD